MTEQFIIRPRLRIGVGGQMTFLMGSRSAIERTHRRSMGVVEEDEVRVMQYLLDEIILHTQRAVGRKTYRCRIEFGASLEEWRWQIQGESGYGCSYAWLKSRDHRYDNAFPKPTPRFPNLLQRS